MAAKPDAVLGLATAVERAFRTACRITWMDCGCRSNTEPILRLVVESADAEWVSRVANTVQNI